MSGKLLTSIRMNATSPASSRPTNNTIGGTGLRMHQAEILRKFMTCLLAPRCGLAARPDALPGIEERPGRQDDRFLTAQTGHHTAARFGDRADLDCSALDLIAAVDDVDVGALGVAQHRAL